MVVHKNTTFGSDRINKMAAIGDYVWLAGFKNIFFKLYWIDFHKTLPGMSSMGWSSENMSVVRRPIDQQDGRQMDYFDWPIFKHLLLWNYWAKLNQTL